MKKNKKDLAKPVVENVVNTISKLLPKIISPGTSPLPGDLFWFEKKGKVSLYRRPKSGMPQNLLHLNGLHFPVPVRLSVSCRTFGGSCDNREFLLLNPEICVDNSTFSTIVYCDMERSSILSTKVSNMIKTGML